MQNPLVVRESSLEVVGHVRFVRIQAIKVVILLIVDIHFNFGKNWMQKFVHMSKKRKWSILHLFLFLRFPCFYSLFWFFLVLFFNFFPVICFVSTIFDKIQFQSQVKLSQVNVIDPIRLNFKLYAVFIKWGSGIRFFVRGMKTHRQLQGISRQGFQKLPKKVDTENYSIWLARNVCRNASLWPAGLFCRLCCKDYASSFFLPPLPSCFLRVCLPTLFAAVSKCFPPLTTSAIFDAANSNISAATCFAAGTVYFHKNGIAFLPFTCASAKGPRPRCRAIPL